MEAILEEPGEPCGPEESATQAVDREQCRDAPEDRATPWREDEARRARRRDLDGGRERRGERRRGQHDERTHGEHDADGAHRVESERRPEERGHHGERRAERVARVARDVVPGEDARPLPRFGERRSDRLFEDERRPALASHAVDHAEERKAEEERQLRDSGDAESARGPEDAQENEEASPPEPITREHRDERGDGVSAETGADDEPHRLRVEREPREVEAEEDSDRPRRERAEERRRVEERAVASLTHALGARPGH